MNNNAHKNNYRNTVITNENYNRSENNYTNGNYFHEDDEKSKVLTNGHGVSHKGMVRSVSAKILNDAKIASNYQEFNSGTFHAGTGERRVLVLYTGGTIGMVKNKDGVLMPIPNAFENLVKKFPQLHDPESCKHSSFLSKEDASYLCLPETKDVKYKIFYKIAEYDPLLDSSNMGVEQWIKLSRDIKENYQSYDGFVVLHGTDTMAYTASALSFMLEHLGKCVVITGSQIPIFEPRSDGADNFVSSLMIAGGFNVPEVTVFFGSKLFRGNRVTKTSVQNLYAFNSPNFVPLVEVGIDFEVNKKAIFRPSKIKKCRLHDAMSKNVGVLRIFPSIQAAVMKAFFQPPIEGVVIQTYGSGNMPSNRKDLFAEIDAAVKRGVIVVNITQCSTGAVDEPIYETGKELSECGVISGYDMTPEAALTKLAYVISKTEWSYEKKIKSMKTNIRGELTNTHSMDIENHFLIDALAKSLNITSTKQLAEVTERVFTGLLLYAIDREDEATIKKIQDMGADFNAQNCEGKTPLHEAIYKGNHNILKYLLLHGANVHLRTRCGVSPLLTAIERDNHTTIKLLIECGAHLTVIDKSVTEMLSLAARNGLINRLESLKLAGADMNAADEMKQTALHKAVICNQLTVVKYLLENGVQQDLEDILGLTPMDYAKRLKHQDIIHTLQEKHV